MDMETTANDRAASLRRRAEAEVQAGEAGGLAALTPEETGRLLHELRVHQIELEMQNEELRRATMSDITERKQVEEALRESEEHYRTLFETAPVIIYTVSTDGMLTALNPAFEQVTGWSRDEWLGRPFAEMFYAGDSALAVQQFQRVLQGAGEGKYSEMRIQSKAGAVLTLEVVGVQQMMDGQVVGISGFARDITERKRAEEHIRRHATQLESLRQVSLELATELDLDTLLRSIVERAIVLVGGRWGSFELYQPELDALVSTAMCGAGPDLSGIPLQRGEGLAGKIWESGQPLIVDDYQHWEGRAAAYDGLPIRAMVGVPVHRGNEFLGVLNIEAWTVGAFASADADLLSLFAAQAAIAIHNARLYRQALQAAERRAVLHRASQEIIRALHDPEQVYQAIHRAAAALMPTEAFVIVLRDEASQQNEAVYLIDRGGRWPARRILAGQGLSGQVIADGQSLLIRDFSPNGALQTVHYGGPEPVRAILAVPLRLGEKVIGMISAQSYQPEVYTAEDEALLEMLAAHAAATLENTWLYNEAQRRNRELTLLNRVIAASVASQGIEPILETVCRELAGYFDASQSAAALFDEEKTQAVVVAEYRAEGRPSALGEVIPVTDNPSMLHLLAHKAPLVVEDAQTDPHLAPVHDLAQRWGTASLLLVPLLIEGEVVGFLGVDAVAARRFSAEEVDLAQRVAGQVGGALARARLQSEQQRLSTAVEQSPDSVLITDTAGAILYANPAFERITGYRREEALGQNPRLLKSGKHDAAFYRDLWQTIGAGQVWQGRLVNRRNDGSLYTEDATISPVRNPAGEIAYYVATMRDVTRELALEEQFHQAQKMEAVGRLAGGVAHDFNNLLTVIHLSTRILERKLHPQDPLWPHVQRIQDASQRAASLTKQLLTFSRREIVEPRVLDLNQVLAELDKMLQRLIGEDVELTLRPAGDLWPVKVDSTQIEQVVVNLAVNARDAMPTGGKLTIETANVTLDAAYAASHLEVQPGQYVVLAVSDTGAGMSDEVKVHLFEPFFTTKERGRGTGLGLATLFGIVKQNGGHVGVYSEVGQGTTFKIYLPKAGMPRVSEAANGQPTSLRPPEQPAAQGTETLLLVEDEPGVRELVRDILLAQGYRVLAAQDGVEALQIARQHQGPIHLLLTDVVMPRMSGRALADQLRSSYPDLRVLFTSGYTDDAIVHHGVLDEGVHFLSKPFESEALARKVREVLEAVRSD